MTLRDSGGFSALGSVGVSGWRSGSGAVFEEVFRGSIKAI